MNGYRVLIVEDDAASCDALLRIMDHRGWVVTVAQTVAEAMVSLDPPPHCILLDLMLPDGGGEDVLRKVRDQKAAVEGRRRHRHERSGAAGAGERDGPRCPVPEALGLPRHLPGGRGGDDALTGEARACLP
jgi:CheY-like chemotaxis protein